MSKTIWKRALKAQEVQEITVPIGAEFLCAKEQNEQVCVWFRCDPGRSVEHRKVAVIGTGNPAPEDGRYIGTASLMNGRLIFHVFVWPQ